MQRRVPAVLTLLALAGAPVLAGCGGDDEDTASSSTATATFRAPVTTAPEPAPPKTPADGQRDPASGPNDKGEPVPTSTTAPSGPSTELTPPGADPTPKTSTETTVERPAKPVYCPAEAKGTSTKAKSRFDARDLLSLSTAEAKAVAKKHDCTVRVVRRDGVDLVRTMDYANTRVNVTETKGRIVRISGIG